MATVHFEHVELTRTIIGCFYHVYNELGYGFLEKAARNIDPKHEAQLLNYLKATCYEVGLLFNFGYDKADLKRKAFSNSRKGSLSWVQPSPDPKNNLRAS